MTALTLLALFSCTDAQVAKVGADSDAQTDSAPPGETDTPRSLSVDGVFEHLDALAAIAEKHDGTRAAGTDGYAASVAYVVERLEAAGYTVTIDPFTFPLFYEEAEPSLSAGDASFRYEDDFATMTYSAPGEVTAAATAIDVVIPPGEANSSTSGCQADDFASFPKGNIALIQRGGCTFGEKAQNAQDAGAVGVIVFNEGQSGRQGVVEGTLGDAFDLTLPVLGASFSVGQQLIAATAPVTMAVRSVREQVETQNVLAEAAGSGEGVLVVGGHLDSVWAGAGLNDNASGSAAVLELAEEIARVGPELVHPVRFAFWGAEELGLLGSTHYVSSLDDDERDEILANLNFDMIASPNFVRFVYDGDGSSAGGAGPAGSAELEELLSAWFSERDLDMEETPFDGRSDYGPFIAVDIPAGGLFSGAEQQKSNLEAEMYGGTPGEPYDACYHRDCDDRSNVNDEAMVEMSSAIFDVTLQVAQTEDALQRMAARQRGDLHKVLRTYPRRGKHFQR